MEAPGAAASTSVTSQLLLDALRGAAVSAAGSNILGELWYLAGRDLRVKRLFPLEEQLKEATATLKRGEAATEGKLPYSKLKQYLAAVGMPAKDPRGKGAEQYEQCSPYPAIRGRFTALKADDGLISHDQILSMITSPFVNLLGSLPDSVRRMSWDATGERMLVHGARVAVVQCRASDRLPATFVAASKPLAPQLPSNSVLAVEWHALSVGHVVLLTFDAVRIYCVDRDSDDPECIIRAPAPVRAAPLSRFCFGPPRGLWLRLSLFLTSVRGEVYALCPVLPVGAPFPAKLLVELRLAAELETEQLATAMHELEEEEVENAERRATWAREVRGRSLAKIATSVYGSSSSSFGQTSASLDESVAESDTDDSGLCMTQVSVNQRSELLTWQSMPMEGVESRPQQSPHTTAVLLLNTDPVILARMQPATGQTELFLILVEPQAQWISTHRGVATSEASPMVLIDSFTLPPGSVLLPDPLQHDRFYAVSALGVRRVLFTWLPSLHRALNSNSDPSAALAELPSSLVEILLHIPPPSSTAYPSDCVCEFLSGRLRRHLLVIANGKPSIVEVDAAILPPPLLVSDAPINVPTSAAPTAKPRPPALPQIGGEFEISLNGAAKLQKMISTLRQEHLIFLAYLREDSLHRADSVKSLAESQAHELQQMRSAVEMQRKNSELLAAKMSACKAKQANIAARLAAVSTLLALHSTSLSEEERAWHEEVRAKQQRAMQLRNAIRERLAGLGPLPTSTPSSAAHLSHIAPLVERQYGTSPFYIRVLRDSFLTMDFYYRQELISANIARLKELKAQLAPQQP